MQLQKGEELSPKLRRGFYVGLLAVFWGVLAAWGSDRLILLAMAATLCLLFWREPREETQSLGKTKLLSSLELTLAIARDAQLFGCLQMLTKSLHQISTSHDVIFRQAALKRLEQLCDTATALGQGVVRFQGTEAWRLTYEELLRSRGLHQYRSVAVIDTAEYWLSEPGRQSLRLNLELHAQEVLRIERIAILSDTLWPDNAELPTERIHAWIHEQYAHGIWIRIARKSQILSEPELLTDMGIYGSRAVGIQTLDEQGRTIEFALTFGMPAVVDAEANWERLGVYAISYAELLDPKCRDR